MGMADKDLPQFQGSVDSNISESVKKHKIIHRAIDYYTFVYWKNLEIQIYLQQK